MNLTIDNINRPRTSSRKTGSSLRNIFSRRQWKTFEWEPSIILWICFERLFRHTSACQFDDGFLWASGRAGARLLRVGDHQRRDDVRRWSITPMHRPTPPSRCYMLEISLWFGIFTWSLLWNNLAPIDWFPLSAVKSVVSMYVMYSGWFLRFQLSSCALSSWITSSYTHKTSSQSPPSLSLDLSPQT